MSTQIAQDITKETNYRVSEKQSNVGLIFASAFGLTASALVACSVPFILPALRKHCLPYVPATDTQLANLTRAFTKHSEKGDKFVDIGSGDGRVCRHASALNIYSEVHGVELNSLLVAYSRLATIRSPFHQRVRYFRDDLWKFQFNNYDAICVFGVDSMMQPLGEYITLKCASKNPTLFACRFPFEQWTPIDEIGEGIDTIWVYRLNKE